MLKNWRKKFEGVMLNQYDRATKYKLHNIYKKEKRIEKT